MPSVRASASLAAAHQEVTILRPDGTVVAHLRGDVWIMEQPEGEPLDAALLGLSEAERDIVWRTSTALGTPNAGALANSVVLPPAGAGFYVVPCRRWINERRKTLLKRSWQAEETCSISVELTRRMVTAPSALIEAWRLAPRT